MAVSIANGDLIHSSTTASLNLPNLPPGTDAGLVMSTFANSLLSIGVFCDAGCTVTFTKDHALIYNSAGILIIRATRETDGPRMWRLDLIKPHAANASTSTPPNVHTNVPNIILPDYDDDDDYAPPRITNSPTTVIDSPDSPTTTSITTTTPTRSMTFHRRAYDLPSVGALIRYHHATLGSPTKSCFLKNIKNGHLRSFPGLTLSAAARYCPEDSTPTVMGHMTQVPQGLRSTKPQLPSQRPLITLQPILPSPIDPSPNDLHIYTVEISTLYTDDMGRFPVESTSGNNYIMLAHHVGSNSILVEAFRKKSDIYRIPAYDRIMERLRARGITVELNILDNECSADYISNITNKWKCKHQRVPPDMHRRNIAERMIRTFKSHLIAIIAGVDPLFPMRRWDLLLNQAEITVNLLRTSKLDPTKSAYEYLYGPFNYDATPMGPPGCKIIAHAKGATRRSWDFRGREGYYVGPAMNHYRCYTLVRAATQAIVVSDTVIFRHHTLSLPSLTTEDRIIHCLRALTTAIQADRTPTRTDDQLLAIESLRAIFSTLQHPPDLQFPAQSPRVPSTPTLAPSPRVIPILPHSTTTVALPRMHAEPTAPSAPPHIASHRRIRPPSDDTPIAHRTRSHHNALSATSTKKVTFSLAPNHRDKDSTIYRMTEWITVPSRSRQHKPSIVQPHVSAAQLAHRPQQANPVLDHATGKTLEHRQLRKHPAYKQVWDRSYGNELGRLCQGIGSIQSTSTSPFKKRVEGTNTMRPIMFHKIPHDRLKDVAHVRVVCDVKLGKEDPNRTRITIGGNTIAYAGDCGTKTGAIEVVKGVFNSVCSRPGAKFLSADITNYYLGTPLDRPEYARIRIEDIPQEFIDEYNLMQYVHNGWVYFEITKGIYGLKQAGKLANDLLTERLSKHGYFQCATTPGLWRHKWRPVVFVLIVDDFGIEYVGKEHAEHLLSALRADYTITTDWTGKRYAGIDIEWDYNKRTCRTTMVDYITDVRARFGHPDPIKPEHSPHTHREIIYGAKEQYAHNDIDTSPPLDAAGIKWCQGVIGALLYYARAVDNKLLMTLSTIAAVQASATENTRAEINKLLNYCATYPNDGITYRASSMVLAGHSDASFNSEPKSRSRAGGHIFLSEDDPIPRNNGPILSISRIIKYVCPSAAEAEIGALFMVAQDMVPLRNMLNEMGWPQPRSPIQTDNSTANGYVNNTIVVKRLKAADMRIDWLRCREAQGQFRIYWDKGPNNNADYHTKRHPPAYHIAKRPTHAG